MVEFIAKLQFSPRNWQIGYYRSTHTWLMQISMWNFWFFFTFTCLLNFFFFYIFKALTYSRADIRGKRSTGERRRVAWPELFIIILPLFWASSIIFQAFIYLRVLEHNGAYAGLSAQVFGYQWGWKYCYSETAYFKLIANPRRVGINRFTVITFTKDDPITLNPNKDMGPARLRYATRQYIKYIKEVMLLNRKRPHNRQIPIEPFDTTIDYSDPETRKQPWLSQKQTFVDKSPTISAEIYYCRQLLANAGVIPNTRLNSFKNQLFQTGLWVAAQGLDPNTVVHNPITGDISVDPLRLLRSTNSLVLPTRTTIRFMGSSEDVTHSWAVPGIGLKIDCVPGRLFYVFNIIMREGVYYGQCSELCGWNHYNMPIVLYALPLEHFLVWWELELHQVLTENRNIPQYLNTDDQNSFANYSLINKKYK